MKNWTGSFQIAAVYVGTIVGAGFATGREIVEFFTQYGGFGFFSIFLAGLLFITLGSKIMVMAIEIQARSYEEFNNYLFGKKLAKAMNLLVFTMLLGVCAVMLSGAEAVFVEQLGLPRYWGALFTIFLTLLVMAIGVKGLFAVNVFIVPLMILFNLYVMIQVLPEIGLFQYILHEESVKDGWKALLSAISYTSFNLTLAQAVLVPIAAEINDKAVVKAGGILGGVILTLILLSSHLSLTTLADVILFDIPMAAIVKSAAENIYFFYLFIIYGEIFTSIIGNLYGLERQIHRYVPVHHLWICGGLLIIIFLISRVNYGTLLGFLYPLFGYVSICFLVLLFLKPLNHKKKI